MRLTIIALCAIALTACALSIASQLVRIGDILQAEAYRVHQQPERQP